MDPRGIEPLSTPCHGVILPVYYGPLEWTVGESNSRIRNLHLVDLPRIELGIIHCECIGIPFTYKPLAGANTIHACQARELRHFARPLHYTNGPYQELYFSILLTYLSIIIYCPIVALLSHFLYNTFYER